MGDDTVHEALDALAGYDLQWCVIHSRPETFAGRRGWYLMIGMWSDSDRLSARAIDRLQQQDPTVLQVKKHWSADGDFRVQLFIAAESTVLENESDAIRQVQEILGRTPPPYLSPSR